MQRACVLLGSSSGRHPAYAEAAREAARLDPGARERLDRPDTWKPPLVHKWLDHASES